RRADEPDHVGRAALGDAVAHGVDDLLLPQLAREVVPLGAEDVAIARVGEGAFSVEMLPAARKAVLEEIVVETALDEDVDTAEVVDQFLEGGEVDAHERMDRLIEDL